MKVLNLFILAIFIVSCKTSTLEKIVFDHSNLNKFSFNVYEKKIKISYKSTLNDSFIEHVMKTSPAERVHAWLENNISNFGTMNKLEVNIQEASVLRKEITTEKKVAGVMKQQDEYLYELNFLVKFNLYNDDKKLLATSDIKVSRSTTSSEFISLNERDHILNKLTLNSLNDLSDKSLELLKIHMSDFML